MCAGLWMGSWRGSPSYPHASHNWGSIRLEGDDALSLRTPKTYVRTLGMGIEGRTVEASTSSGSRSLRGIAKNSGMSVLTWANNKGDSSSATSPAASARQLKNAATVTHFEGDESCRARQVITTLALLQTFHTNTSIILARLAELVPQRRAQMRVEGGPPVDIIALTPKDVISFELGPFSGLDARFIEWLGDEYGGDLKVVVRRNWRDLIGLIFGLG